MTDHLSFKITFLRTRGWSLKRRPTVLLSLV